MVDLKKYLAEGMPAPGYDPIASEFRAVTDDISNRMDRIVQETKKYDKKLASKIDKYFNSYFKQMEKFQLDAEWARKSKVNP